MTEVLKIYPYIWIVPIFFIMCYILLIYESNGPCIGNTKKISKFLAFILPSTD